MNKQEFIQIIRKVFQEKKYFFILIIIAVLAFLTLYRLLLNSIADHSLNIYIMMSGYDYTYFALLSFVIISLLFGLYLSIAVYKFNLIRKSSRKNKKGFFGNIFGFFGFFAGVFGAGCPTCGSFMFALIGAPLALMYLPFKGAELRILSIFVLMISIYFLTNSLNSCNTCKVK